MIPSLLHSHAFRSQAAKRASRFRTIISLALLIAPALSLAQSLPETEGEVVFQETFQNHPPGSAPARPWSTVLSRGPVNTIQIVTDSEDRFGRGPSNKILEYRKEGIAGSQAVRIDDAFSAEIFKMRFDYFQPDDGLDGYTWLILYAGARSTDDRAQVITLARNHSLAGTDGHYERGQPQEVTFVINNSSRPTAYDGDNIVAAGSVDIWINGERTHASFSHQNNKRGPVTGFEFNTAGSREHHFFIDNLTVEMVQPRPVPVGVIPQPATHPPLAPVDGETVAVNPPPMVWQHENRAVSYILEFSRDPSFAQPDGRIEDLEFPFYNHSETFEPGAWFWRHFLVNKDGEELGPSPVRRFYVPEGAVEIPVPPTNELLANMPDHPRVFTTPEDLADFRARRHGPAKQAWESVRWQADQQLGRKARRPNTLLPLAENPPKGPTPGMEGRWQEGSPVRRQVIWLIDGEPFVSPGYSYRNLNSDASRAHTLSFAYLISGDTKYAEAAKDWLLMIAPARLDYHLKDRASHDTVVYSYETGLKYAALTYDRIYHHLTPEERQQVVDHIAFHGEAAYEWLRERCLIHLNYQQSHPQQAMHAFLTTMLAVGDEFPEAAEWIDWLVRQYVNRIAWTSPDGGYFEGQTYGHKFRWILEGLVALRTATGIDLFKQPRIANSGEFWLYAMNLNYWFHHGGDVYSLLWPWGNPADGYMTNLVASMNENPYVKWYADTVNTDPEHVPFQYLSEIDLDPAPPIDIPQARAFLQTGQVAAYDQFYNHLSDRIFFRSSPWGGHSHSHADQNNFVIHSGAEILAADVGYYTYYGDEYHTNWSRTTFTHNTILINGEGQPKSIDSKGKISAFFNSPDYTFFAGDASAAYREPMERFERAILFIRPGVYVIYDELQASEPSEFTWLLNAFQEAEIDEAGRTMTVPQQDRRLRVRHLLPRKVEYKQSNERRYPILTRAWARVSEAFPEPAHIRVNTAEKAEDQRFLALLNTYGAAEGDPLTNIVRIDNNNTHGMAFTHDGTTETILFRHKLREPGVIEGLGMGADGLAATVRTNDDGTVARWLLSGGTAIEANGIRLTHLEKGGDISGTFEGAAAAIFRLSTEEAQRARLYVPARPQAVWLVPNQDWSAAESVPFDWSNAILTVQWPGGDGSLFVDPHWDPAAALPELSLAIRDSSGEQSVPLRTFVADNGEWVAYARIDPREAGEYRLTSDRDDIKILIQDRWTPRESVEAVGTAEGVLRAQTELFFRFDPAGGLPRLRADLAESYRGKIVNYLRNGDFEEGIPNYPPRGWVVNRSSRSAEKAWPGWSQEDAFSGESALKFVRPKDRVVSRSHPMRLPHGGKYLLRFQAKGDATHARVRVNGSGGSGGTVAIDPSNSWTGYEAEFDMAPGYTEIHIEMNSGGEPNQTLWVDAMEFGEILDF